MTLLLQAERKLHGVQANYSLRSLDAYRSYRAWCVQLGYKPADYVTWNAATGKISSQTDPIKFGHVSVLRHGK